MSNHSRNKSKRLVTLLLAALALTLLAVSAAQSEPENYAQILQRAIQQMDHGEYNAAVASLDEALTLEPSEPVGRVALAVALSHTRKIDLAIDELSEVLAAYPGNGLAAYGLATCLLSEGELKQAKAWYAQSSKSGQCDAGAAIAYIKLLSGQTAEAAKPISHNRGGRDLADLFVEADALRKLGREDEAQSLLVELVPLARKPWYDEDYGAVMSLERQSPIKFTGEALTSLPQMRVSANAKMPKVKGDVTLRPDATAPAGTQFVTFSIDGSVAGIVNSEPYAFNWNTTRYANGIHTVSVSIESASGPQVAGKTMRYWVQNSAPGKGNEISGPEAESLRAALWNRMRLRPSIKLACYYAGKYYCKQSEWGKAAGYLEQAVACDPGYSDARLLLCKCYGRSGYKQVSSGPKSAKFVALTFDDGPNKSTQALLDLLDKLDVRATFFMVGKQIQAQPTLVKSMAEKGHDIEIHTFNHRNMGQLTEREAEQELLKCAAVIRDVTGKECAFFRPPGGHLSAAAQVAAARYGLTGVFWNIGCNKYEGMPPASMAQYVSSTIQGGAIILMHNGNETAMKALPDIVSDLKGRGYRFVTVSELVGRR
jgi:peptidoglycan-N-acetylglucosamine deacetylase